MKTKQDLIQIRVDPELKQEFFQLAEKQGVSPSNLLRSLMHQALEREDVKIANAESNIQSIHTILFEILKYLQRIAFESNDDRIWQAFTSSFIPEYLDEMIGQTLRDSDIKGEQYQAHYWQSIDEAWGTSFSEQRPLLAIHLKRDVMNEIRDQKKRTSIKRT
jgi:antitoxin component of RelBE/YafQ-DinJ toxin-antitoxin module